MLLNPNDYTHVQRNIVLSARVHKLPFRLTKHRAFTIDRHIFTIAPQDMALIAHELVHVEQYYRLGVDRFIIKYFSEYLKYRLGGYKDGAAYRKISLEQEARDGAALWLTNAPK